MKVWAFNKPSEIEFVYESLLKGYSRFGWGYIDEANLEISKDKEWSDKSEHEKICWKQSKFLLNIEEGDWIVHINVPENGKCTTAKVVSRYKFEQGNNRVGDFRHMLGVDINTVFTFDRNNPNIVPVVSARLKLQGKYWRIYRVQEFIDSLENVKINKVNDRCFSR